MRAGYQESLAQRTSTNVLKSINVYLTMTTMKVKIFLSRIVTRDEIWVHHYKPQSKSVEWKHPGSPVMKKFKTQSSTRKVMPTVCFKLKKGLYRKITWKRRCMINSPWCSDLLAKILKSAIYTECQSLLLKKVLLLHDNIQPGFWSAGTPCLQSRSCTFWLSSFWATQRYFIRWSISYDDKYYLKCQSFHGLER